MTIFGKDVNAYNAWEDYHYGDKSKLHDGDLLEFEDFMAHYLGISKIGSVDLEHRKRIIYTTETMPHVTFENWIRDGYKLMHPETRYGFDFDPKSKLFVPTKPVGSDFAIDTEKRRQLEDELGRETQV